MWKKVISVAIVLVYIVAFAAPAFALDGLDLTDELLNSLFWSMSRQVGLSGENLNSPSNDTTLSSVGLDDIVDNYTSWFGLSEIEAIWDDIKNDITDLGTVKYSSGREVPNMKLRVTSENVNSIKKFGYSVQEFWKQHAGLNNASNAEWVTINQLFGGYLTYGSLFSSIQVINTNSNWRTGSYGTFEQYGFFTIGMDLYQHATTDGTYYHLIHFDDTDNTVELVNNASWSGTSKTLLNNNVYLLYVQQFNLSGSANVVIGMPSNGKTNSSGTARWFRGAVFNDSQFEAFLNKTGNLVNNGLTSGGQIYVDAGQTNKSAILPGGIYYYVTALQLNIPTNNRKLRITNDIALNVDNNPYYVRNRIYGVGRTATWSVDITDSGTGLPITLPDALYTYFPTIYDDDRDLPYVYFPSSIGYVPDLTDVLSTDYPLTGEIADSPSVPGDGTTPDQSVTVDLVPPSSFNFGSIWHYVQDTYDYVSAWIGQVLSIWTYTVPSIVRSAAYSFVVVGIVFGIYRRLIE